MLASRCAAAVRLFHDFSVAVVAHAQGGGGVATQMPGTWRTLVWIVVVVVAVVKKRRKMMMMIMMTMMMQTVRSAVSVDTESERGNF